MTFRKLIITFNTLLLLFGYFGLRAGENQVKLVLNLECSSDSLYIYDFNGLNFYPLRSQILYNDTINYLQISESEVILIGTEKTQKLPIFISPGDSVYVSGNCQSLRASKVESPLNQIFQEVRSRKRNDSRAFGQMINKYRAYFRDSMKVKAVIAEMAVLDKAKLEYLDQLASSDELLAQIYALDLYLSFHNHGGKYANEIEYFIAEYFSFADFSKKEFNRIPDVYEGFTNYLKTLTKLVSEDQRIIEILNDKMDNLSKPSKAHQYALGGIIQTTKKSNIGVYIHYANEYVEHYGRLYQADAKSLKESIKNLEKLMIGKVAPDLELENPEGEITCVSDFRGKILLIDFWASWCGPCRKENPNVVKAYNKYQDKGFEVLSVSLDKNREKWLEAIEKDGLNWHHVSDLKGWQSIATEVYNISSIPKTYILDEKGVIVAKNLRGDDLENTLADLIQANQ